MTLPSSLPPRLAGIVARLSAAIPAPAATPPKPRKRWASFQVGQRYKLTRDLHLLSQPASHLSVGVTLPPVRLPWGTILAAVACDSEGVTLEMVPPCPPDTSPEEQGWWLDTYRTARTFRWSQPASGLFTPLTKPRKSAKKVKPATQKTVDSQPAND